MPTGALLLAIVYTGSGNYRFLLLGGPFLGRTGNWLIGIGLHHFLHLNRLEILVLLRYLARWCPRNYFCPCYRSTLRDTSPEERSLGCKVCGNRPT